MKGFVIVDKASGDVLEVQVRDTDDPTFISKGAAVCASEDDAKSLLATVFGPHESFWLHRFAVVPFDGGLIGPFVHYPFEDRQ